jgi:ERCC4-type nuclease
MITAILIDSREPAWVQALNFGGIPTMITTMDAGDVWAVTDDGHTLMIERKTPEDFLGSLRDERLMPQLARLAEPRQTQQEKGERPTSWPYLVITDEFKRSGQKVFTERETGWSWAALQGALLLIQEMGIFIDVCAGDSDFESCIRRLGERNRDSVLNLLPPRQPVLWGAKEGFIASLPGIGQEKTLKIMEWADNNLSYALIGLVDLSITCPVEGVGEITRKKIRSFLGLDNGKNIELVLDEANRIVLKEM